MCSMKAWWLDAWAGALKRRGEVATRGPLPLMRLAALAIAGSISLAGCDDRAPSATLTTTAGDHAVTPGEARALFVTHCAACHGTEGHGDGPAADQLYPRPRAFKDSPLRFASLDAGPLAARDGVVRTIRLGVPRSAMPGFDGVLSNAQIQGIADYVLSMGRGLTRDPSIPPDQMRHLLSTVPDLENDGLIQRGRELFAMWKCTSCHGPYGHGDGEEMNRLVDSLGMPIQPANLTSGLFKSGGTPSEIFRVISNGVPGTPMTPYAGLLLRENPDTSIFTQDIWALVAYVRSLAPKWRTGGKPSGLELKIHDLASEAMLGDLSHPDWTNVTWQQVALRPTWERSAEPVSVHVAAIRAAGRVGVLLSWPDATMDIAKDFGRFPDAAAVMFALGDQVPAIPMGVGIEGASQPGRVNIWLWKGDRQRDATAGQRRLTPLAESDGGDGRREFAVSPDSPAPPGAGVDDAEFALIPSASVGNVHSDPALALHAGLEANASGFGTLDYQDAGDQGVTGWAVWAPERWTAIMHRGEASGEDIRFARGARIPVAFAVWDGSQGHRDGTKFVSGWHWLVVD